MLLSSRGVLETLGANGATGATFERYSIQLRRCLLGLMPGSVGGGGAEKLGGAGAPAGSTINPVSYLTLPRELV